MAHHKRKKLHEYTLQDDIRYLGPMNYQWFQALGWLCIALSFAAFLLRTGSMMDDRVRQQAERLEDLLSVLPSLSLPFLLISNFARILNNDEGYKKQLLRNGLAALSIFAVSCFVFSRYVIGGLGKLLTDPENLLPLLTDLFVKASKTGFISFNLYIDLFLCTLFMFFLTARPKRVFTGKKLLILRCMVILPVAWEIASWLLKWNAAEGNIILPFWSFPLLTVKPPMTFLVFVVLVLYVKNRGRRFRRHGRTHEEYQQFLKTRRNSLHFSVFLAVILVVAAVLDTLILLGAVHYESDRVTARYNEMDAAEIAELRDIYLSEEDEAEDGFLPEGIDAEDFSLPEEIAAEDSSGTDAGDDEYTLSDQDAEELVEMLLEDLIRPGRAVGLGASWPLLFVAPFVLLFSYTRVPKNRSLSILIPVAGVVLMVFLFMEGVRAAMGYLPFGKFSLKDMGDFTKQ